MRGRHNLPLVLESGVDGSTIASSGGSCSAQQHCYIGGRLTLIRDEEATVIEVILFDKGIVPDESVDLDLRLLLE